MFVLKGSRSLMVVTIDLFFVVALLSASVLKHIVTLANGLQCVNNQLRLSQDATNMQRISATPTSEREQAVL